MTKRKTTAAKDTQPDIGAIEREVGTLVADLASAKVAVNSLLVRLAAAEQAIAGLKAENVTLAARMRSLVNERPPARDRFAFLRRLLGVRR